MISHERLQRAIEKSWSPDTAFYTSDYSVENPARGQCVPTALVVQRYFGGDLQKLVTQYEGREEVHYRNILEDSSVIDYTRKQYPANQGLELGTIDLGQYGSIREKRLADTATRNRYELLLKRVEDALGS